ncbi:hypothetical protein ACFFRR_011766 [Megaselia abdita]
MNTAICFFILVVAACYAAPPESVENKKQANQIVIQKPFQDPQYYYKPVSYYPQYISPDQFSSQYYTYRTPIYSPTGPIYTQPIVKAAYTYPFNSFPSVASSPLVSYDYKPLVSVESH